MNPEGIRRHPVAAGHESRGGRKRYTAGIFERLAWLEHRLLADHAGSLHFLAPAEPICDAPVPRAQLDCVRAAVDDLDGIGPEIFVALRRGALGEILWRHRDFDVACDGLIHGCSLVTMVSTAPPVWYWNAFRAGAQWSQLRHFSIRRDRTMIRSGEETGTAWLLACHHGFDSATRLVLERVPIPDGWRCRNHG